MNEPWLYEWWAKIVACPRRLALDVGANSGEWTMALRVLFETVVSLEPDERCQPPHGHTYDRRAVWSETGEETLYRRDRALQSSLLPEHAVGDGTKTISVVDQLTVPTVTLDDLAVEHGPPDFIKVDIEGAEVQAMAGATLPCFSACRWLIEIHDTRTEVARQAMRLGYEQVHLIPHPHPEAAEGHEWMFLEPTDGRVDHA